ncbi:hypothetical protein HMPREF1981_00410 [Bacteroides pyogenes F0041]|uniref:Uncharacterized protein n=1 Tax=Bacteroides pyogenes F0041 TaxID=1321819 RepID=U2CVQ5_9BACE|nr:hypothetical protein HMPREF1981_00410 [Bacteroides pyogenes F0041]
MASTQEAEDVTLSKRHTGKLIITKTNKLSHYFFKITQSNFTFY